MGMTWLAGFPPYALLASLLTAGWAAMLCLQLGRRSGFLAAAELAGWISAASLIGIALSAVQILPTLEYSLASFRGDAPFAAWVLGVARRTVAGRFKRKQLGGSDLQPSRKGGWSSEGNRIGQ